MNLLMVSLFSPDDRVLDNAERYVYSRVLKKMFSGYRGKV